MPNEQQLARLVAQARVAVGAGAALAPGMFVRVLSGRRQADPTAVLLARLFGVRDVSLGLGVLIALRREAPVRGWIEACMLSDAVDGLSCLMARGKLPTPILAAAGGSGAGSAALGAVLARRLSED